MDVRTTDTIFDDQAHIVTGREFIEAAKDGDIVMVEKYLKQGGDVNFIDSCDEEPATALYWAACYGYTHIVFKLIINNAHLDMHNKNESTPLHAAVDRNHIEIVGLLLVNRAQVNVQNVQFNTPLHLAVIRKRLDIARMLLESGAVVADFPNQKGRTPMQEAHSAKNYEMYQLLSKYYRGQQRGVTPAFSSNTTVISTTCERQYPPKEVTCEIPYGSSHAAGEDRQKAEQKMTTHPTDLRMSVNIGQNNRKPNTAPKCSIDSGRPTAQHYSSRPINGNSKHGYNIPIGNTSNENSAKQIVGHGTKGKTVKKTSQYMDGAKVEHRNITFNTQPGPNGHLKLTPRRVKEQFDLNHNGAMRSNVSDIYSSCGLSNNTDSATDKYDSSPKHNNKTDDPFYYKQTQLVTPFVDYTSGEKGGQVGTSYLSEEEDRGLDDRLGQLNLSEKEDNIIKDKPANQISHQQEGHGDVEPCYPPPLVETYTNNLGADLCEQEVSEQKVNQERHSTQPGTTSQTMRQQQGSDLVWPNNQGVVTQHNKSHSHISTETILRKKPSHFTSGFREGKSSSAPNTSNQPVESSDWSTLMSESSPDADFSDLNYGTLSLATHANRFKQVPPSPELVDETRRHLLRPKEQILPASSDRLPPHHSNQPYQRRSDDISCAGAGHQRHTASWDGSRSCSQCDISRTYVSQLEADRLTTQQQLSDSTQELFFQLSLNKSLHTEVERLQRIIQSSGSQPATARRPQLLESNRASSNQPARTKHDRFSDSFLPGMSSSSSSSSRCSSPRCLSLPAGAGASHTQLYTTIRPLFKVMGADFLQAMSLTLIEKVKAFARSEQCKELDKAGSVWLPDQHFLLTGFAENINDGVVNYTLLGICHNKMQYNLKMLPVAESSFPSVDRGVLPSTPHPNVTPPHHTFPLSAPFPTEYCRILQHCGLPFAADTCFHVSVLPQYPTTLYEILHESKSKSSCTIRFGCQLLFSILSACVHLLDHGLLLTNLAPQSIYLDHTLNVRVMLDDKGLPDKRQVPESSSTPGLRSVWSLLADYIVHTSPRQAAGGGSPPSTFPPIHGSPPLATDLSTPVVTEHVANVLSRLQAGNMTLRDARVQVGMLMFGPRGDEVAMETDCQVWLHSKLMKLLVAPPQHSGLSPSDAVLTISAATAQQQPHLEVDFVTTVSAKQLWQQHQLLFSQSASTTL